MPHRMASVRTRDTAPELALRAALARLGTRGSTLNDASLPGSPDVALHGPRAALFAHGCFWHHHPGCPCARIPRSAYPWAQKFQRNQRRDRAVRTALLERGWRVAWIWECSLVGRQALTTIDLDNELRRFLGSCDPFCDIAG